MTEATPPLGDQKVRPLAVTLAVVIGVSFIGFGVGTSGAPAEGAPVRQVYSAPEGVMVGDVPIARSYTALRDGPRESGAGWEADRAALLAMIPSRMDEVSLEGTSKQEVLATRASRRAYDGAPPTIPHAIRQDSALECRACHDTGIRIRGRLAPPRAHELYASCTQCHVVSNAPMIEADWLGEGWPAPETNSFVGRESPSEGPRAWDMTPPVIPHRTFMRERCDSCHGPNGRDAMRSTHPSRQSCEQCHGLSAQLDQRPMMAME